MVREGGVICRNELEIVEQLKLLVEQAGYELLTARDGHQALQLCQDENPALMLVDINIPGVDGIKTVRLLRDDGYNNPIVVLTRQVSAGDRDRAIDAGCDDYILKTGATDAVATTLDRHFRDASGGF